VLKKILEKEEEEEEEEEEESKWRGRCGYLHCCCFVLLGCVLID